MFLKWHTGKNLLLRKKYIWNMTELTIDKKKYVLIPDKEYKILQKKAALKSKSEKLLLVEDARAYSKKLIRQK